ncbi:MAG TPA: hypothetical protein IGS37_19750 [Synechococcales cyanobacterium M55_K2018_004]|nr:hypothetical protein [Synechococcales cyanobacterium M55_K2018_004]
MEPNQVNCKVDCVNGCILGDRCPNLEYKAQAAQFIAKTSLDDMLAIAEEALRKKMTQPTQWVFPDDGIKPGE